MMPIRRVGFVLTLILVMVVEFVQTGATARSPLKRPGVSSFPAGLLNPVMADNPSVAKPNIARDSVK